MDNETWWLHWIDQFVTRINREDIKLIANLDNDDLVNMSILLRDECQNRA